MKPFIKWPGGKDGELKYILPAKPNVIRNYIEPFLGGGAVFFALDDDEVTGNFFLNDLSNDLIDTYRFVQTRNNDFFEQMMVIDQNNKKMAEIVCNHLDRIHQLFDEVSQVVFKEYYRLVKMKNDNENLSKTNEEELPLADEKVNDSQFFEKGKIETNALEEPIREKVDEQLLKNAEKNVVQERNKIINQFIEEICEDIQLEGNLNIDTSTYVSAIKSMTVRRINSMIIQSSDPENTEIELQDVFECVFKAAFYTHLREIYNKRNNGQCRYNQAQISAIYLYIRDNCYSAMHRTNPRGEFNVPYGGISYNPHNFDAKRQYLLEEQFQARLQRAVICNEDFELFLNRMAIDTTPEDFWFIDPPYDSKFSEYSQNEFGPEDHIRLAELLSRTPAKIMVVIKKTEFIENLYSQYPVFHMSTFSKLYDVNFHNRNSREVEHLIITNYEINAN